MNQILLLIIIFGAFYLALLGVTGWLIWKQWNYRTKTPAEEFLKARKKGKLLSIDLYESGKLGYTVSDESDSVSKDGEITNLSPLSTFIDSKSKATVTLRYNTSTVNGQTLSPLFVYLTQKINMFVKAGYSKANALLGAVLTAEKEDEQGTKKLNITERLSLSHIKGFLKYNNAKGNYTTAHRIASIMYKKGWKETIKFIALLIGGAIAGVILIGGIYIIFTKLNMASPEITVQLVNQTVNKAVENMANATLVTV